MSDFGYWSWPLDLVGVEEQIRREIADSESQGDFAMKEKQVVWRGAVKTNKFRKILLRVTAGKEWADVQSTQWANVTDLKDSTTAWTIPEHCQYQFVIRTEGMHLYHVTICSYIFWAINRTKVATDLLEFRSQLL